MTPDDFKRAWQEQPSRTVFVDADLMLKELRRNDAHFAAMIFWRDVREIGTSLLLVPLWFYLGAKFSSPWTWYLTVPALLWVAGYLLADRMRHRRQTPRPGESLRQCVASSLAQLEHQIGLLRNVAWWYLLPLALPLLAFFGQIAWRQRSEGWRAAVATSVAVALVAVVFAGVYWLNQYAVQCGLEPRRRELKTLLASLDDETPEANREFKK
jgi:hypothetical protein